MSVYLDASFIVAFFTSQEPLTSRAEGFLDSFEPKLIVSDFATAEFSSAIARLVRTGAIRPQDANSIFGDFDVWTARTTQRAETTTADVIAANAFIRRLALNLRTPDAINIAIAQRAGATLATFDTRMAENAVALGLDVAPLV